METPFRIVVTGGDERACGCAYDLLQAAGFTDTTWVATPAQLHGNMIPDLVAVVGDDIGSSCRAVKELAVLADVPLLAVTAEHVTALTAGADEVLSPSPRDDESSIAVTRARVRCLITAARHRGKAHFLEHMSEAMLQVQTLSSNDGDSPEALRAILQVALEVMSFERASLIAYHESSELAYVIAATDDPSLSNFALEIKVYPEIIAVLTSGEPLLIDDIQNDPMTASVAQLLADKDLHGIALFPVTWRNKTLGAVSFRKSTPGVSHVDKHRMAFGRMFAKHAAARLQHGHVLDSLRDHSDRITPDRYEAERRLRTIDSLREYFDASADAVLVIDQGGTILYSDRSTEELTGFTQKELRGASIDMLVPEAHRESIRSVISQVLAGHNVDAFDLALSTVNAETLYVSVTTSTVLKSSAAILSLRDVTAQRGLESELRKTKEFLEKLVYSTVDAIIAADMHGNIIVFNQGAERIYGYRADEVIGRISVWQLYAPGVARQIMRMLRSTQYGGVGRLELTRREILTKSGELVPVNMTASIIYEDGVEVATVGIFSDLRERIRIEQRLLQAQEKLQITEKQAVIAELAGATAHELNQPLTSILAYLELIQRKSHADDPHIRAIEIISQEAHRMAQIVKKISQITKYETKKYVNETRILDLDKSSRDPRHDQAPLLPLKPAPGDDEDSELGFESGFEDDPTGRVAVSALIAKHGRSYLADYHDDDDDEEITELVDYQSTAEGQRLTREHLFDVAVPDLEVDEDDEVTGQVEVEIPRRGRPLTSDLDDVRDEPTTQNLSGIQDDDE